MCMKGDIEGAERMNAQINDLREKEILLKNFIIIEENQKAVVLLVRRADAAQRGANQRVQRELGRNHLRAHGGVQKDRKRADRAARG